MFHSSALKSSKLYKRYTLYVLILSGVIFGYLNGTPAYAAFTQPADSTKAPENWFNLDPEKDNVMGVGANRAYQTLLKGKKSSTVIVAVIDSGVDIEHEDLQGKIWVNADEIPNNGKDDDNNGYVDDVHGWNFIGGKDGKNVSADTHELTRLYAQLKEKYGNKGKVKKKDRKEFEYWLKVKKDFEKTYEEANQQYLFYSTVQKGITRYNTLLKSYLDVDSLGTEQIKGIDSSDPVITQAKTSLEMILNNSGGEMSLEEIIKELAKGVEHYSDQVKYTYNVDFDPRGIVGDNYDDLNEKGYGNSDVEGPDAEHGTHVAGIIAADRNNNLGIKGIAENVKIMSVRAVPNGDERDKDVANAIRYAVDNGAKIINMSFGKSYSPHKEVVDAAVKYAEEKGVLLIHAAGNSSKDVDVKDNFPNRHLVLKGTDATNWMEIGASAWGRDENLVGFFSNYGDNSVDLFSPGVAMHSTTPDNGYMTHDGTSMAAPAVTGVAALLLSYYPKLSATQVREILRKSSLKLSDMDVIRPGGTGTVKFGKLSMTGGLVNAYEALKMAESMSTN